MPVLIDIEADSLTPTRLWVVVTRDVGEKEDRVWALPTEEPTRSSFVSYISGSDQLVGHNIVGFDWPVLKQFFPELPDIPLLDTLVVSRLTHAKRPGGHSLDSWGERLGEKKIKFDDFSALTPDMVTYCRQDVEVTRKVYEHLHRFIVSPQWQEAIENEHKAAKLSKDMHDHGFWFDIDSATKLRDELAERLRDLDEYITREFRPRAKPVREVTPRLTKSGTLHSGDFKWLSAGPTGVRDLSAFSADAPFTVIEWVPFNPASPSQMVERLNEAGWKPTEKTKGHLQAIKDRDKVKLEQYKKTGWKVSEENLKTLPADAPEAARRLAERVTIASRLSDLEEWIALYRPDTHRIHGNFIHIGSWTHRMAHQNPNTGNIASVFAIPEDVKEGKRELSPVEQIKHDYDGRMRALFGVPPGHWQIGVDMESAHLRVLAHLIDDKEFTQAMISGDKKLGTDPHSMNKRALGPVCQTRDDAKTFIYTFLNGGAAPKIATVLKTTVSKAKEALQQFRSAYPGLKVLLATEIPKNAARGYFEGIDGRYVIYSEEHGQLSGILQNAEKIILTWGVWWARERCRELGLPVHILNMVHDEVQVELAKDDEALAWKIGEIFREGYVRAAEHYKLRCPFAGGINVGRNWRDCH